MEDVRIPLEEEDSSWKQRCNERLDKLKTRHFTCSEDRNAGTARPSRKIGQEFFVEKTYMNSEVYEALRDEDPNNFVDVLERVSEEEKLLLSEIVCQITHGGDTLLHVAAKFGREKIVELIAGHYPSLLTEINIRGNTALHVAARQKGSEGAKFGTEKIAELIAGHCPSPLTGINIRGSTAPHVAARPKGSEGSYPGGSNVIKVILSQYDAEKQKSGNTSSRLTRLKNFLGNTPLHEAVKKRHLDAVKLLFEEDSGVAHYVNNEKKSPLYVAIQDYICGKKGKDSAKDIVDCLLDVSLLKDRPESGWWDNRQSPLHAVIDAESERKRKHWLSALQLSENTIIKALLTRYTAQTDNSSKDLLKTIIEKRPEALYLKDSDGATPLHFAARYGYVDGFHVMLEKYDRAALEGDVYGNLPIHTACQLGKIDVVKELVERNCPKLLLNHKGQNILHVAAMHGKHDVVKYILTLTDDIHIKFNERDKDGNTPLHAASIGMYPMVLFYLTRDRRINKDTRDMQGLTARDIVLQQSQRPRTYREVLCHAVLSSANAICNKEVYKELQSQHDKVQMKDLVNTLMLVAILIATVTFAAGFTVPGSVYGSDDPNPQQRGMAVLAKRTVFQIFMVCNTVAMYSSAVGSFLLLWAQLGDYHLARNSFNFALHMVAWALLTTSGAFMAAAHLVVHNVSWLTILIRSIGAISILFILSAYVLFIFPLESDHPLLRPISRIFIRILIPFAGSYESPQQGKKKKKKKKKSET